MMTEQTNCTSVSASGGLYCELLAGHEGSHIGHYNIGIGSWEDDMGPCPNCGLIEGCHTPSCYLDPDGCDHSDSRVCEGLGQFTGGGN